MDFKKTILTSSISIALGTVSFSVKANLTTSAVLNFNTGTVNTIACIYGTTPPCAQQSFDVTDIVGSYFGVDYNNDGSFNPFEKTVMGQFNGIHIGVAQSASGSHSGGPDGSESPSIDAPWAWLGNTGMHQTTSPITVLADNGFTKTLDFSGWGWTWNGIPNIPLVDMGTTITCNTASCSDTSSYTLDGVFHFNGAKFTSAPYALHLEGTVSSIPVPASAWLFSSGLIGVIGMARRRRKIIN